LSLRGARLLLRVTAPLAPAVAVPEPGEPEPELSSVETSPAAAAVAGKAPQRWKRPAAKAPGALFVSQATVLELARSSARPRGAFVAETSEHPAGLRLSGVAALGIGVQDGDILIEALGITPRSPGQVIGAIIEARAQKARVLSGTLWRQGQTL